MEMLKSLETGDLFLWDEENKTLTRIQVSTKPYKVKVQAVRANNVVLNLFPLTQKYKMPSVFRKGE